MVESPWLVLPIDLLSQVGGRGAQEKKKRVWFGLRLCIASRITLLCTN